MIEVTIRTGNENEIALHKLLEFISTIGFEVVEEKRTANGKAAEPEEPSVPEPPIQWAEVPENMEEMFGIWKDNPMTLEELRKLAWGDRL
ncbi:MAG: hypothetical protein KDD27_09125 [Saprospiraceae bacterium]|nr:hypothetical protein [Saprospiraceae bacterium]